MTYRYRLAGWSLEGYEGGEGLLTHVVNVGSLLREALNIAEITTNQHTLIFALVSFWLTVHLG